ncbi:Aldehyde/histidinol dehydrogenase [Blastocladiella britannica]|nr:Aldehyde/histidinol dehydrogenase [Blastocladiella britannica]
MTTIATNELTPTELTALASSARAASRVLASASTATRNAVLSTLADQLAAHRESVVSANAADLAFARALVDKGELSEATYKRLDVAGGPAGEKYNALVQGVRDVVALDDPLNQITLARELDRGLDLYRVTVPIGVVLIIFEARPEVVVQISALAIKSGNAVVLKGGKEATHSLRALHTHVQTALAAHGLPPSCVHLVEGRAAIAHLLTLDHLLDLCIPRGSNALVKSIKESTRIPVLGHADGICAMYVDAAYPDVDMCARVAVDAKTQYPAACNALETLLVHASVVDTVWPVMARALLDAGVELRCDAATLAVASTLANQSTKTVIPATPADYDTEFLTHTLAVRTVSSLQDAMDHIHAHGSGHTDVILTADEHTANTFMRTIDSAGVYWNCSSRFADGFRYGFGAEIGVSTNKLHARGPVGLEGMVTYKYRMHGNGHTVAQYSADGGRTYTHKTRTGHGDIPADALRMIQQ